MNELKYKEYISKGGKLPFDEWNSISSIMSEQDIFELYDNQLLKKKDDTQVVQQKTSEEGEPKPTFPSSQDEPMITSVPISNDLQLNQAQQEALNQAMAQPNGNSNLESALPLADTTSSVDLGGIPQDSSSASQDFNTFLEQGIQLPSNPNNNRINFTYDTNYENQFNNTTTATPQVSVTENINTTSPSKPKKLVDKTNDTSNLIEIEIPQYEEKDLDGNILAKINSDVKRAFTDAIGNTILETDNGLFPIDIYINYKDSKGNQKSPSAIDSYENINGIMNKPLISDAPINESLKTLKGIDYISSKNFGGKDIAGNPITKEQEINIYQDYQSRGLGTLEYDENGNPQFKINQNTIGELDKLYGLDELNKDISNRNKYANKQYIESVAIGAEIEKQSREDAIDKFGADMVDKYGQLPSELMLQKKFKEQYQNLISKGYTEQQAQQDVKYTIQQERNLLTQDNDFILRNIDSGITAFGKNDEEEKQAWRDIANQYPTEFKQFFKNYTEIYGDKPFENSYLKKRLSDGLRRGEIKDELINYIRTNQYYSESYLKNKENEAQMELRNASKSKDINGVNSAMSKLAEINNTRAFIRQDTNKINALENSIKTKFKEDYANKQANALTEASADRGEISGLTKLYGAKLANVPTNIMGNAFQTLTSALTGNSKWSQYVNQDIEFAKNIGRLNKEALNLRQDVVFYTDKQGNKYKYTLGNLYKLDKDGNEVYDAKIDNNDFLSNLKETGRDKEWSISSVTATTTQVIAEMYLTNKLGVGLGNLASKPFSAYAIRTAKELGTESRWYNILKTTAKGIKATENSSPIGMAVYTFGNNVRRNNEMGYDGMESWFKGVFDSGMMAAANRFFPDSRFFKEGDEVQKTAYALLKSGDKKGAVQVMKNFFTDVSYYSKPIIKETSFENFQESILEPMFQGVSDVVSAGLKGDRNKWQQATKAENFYDLSPETILATTLSTGLISGVQLSRTKELPKLNGLNKLEQLILSSNTAGLVDALKFIKEDGSFTGFTAQMADTKLKEIATVQSYLNKLPKENNLSIQQTASAITNLQKLENLKKEQQSATSESVKNNLQEQINEVEAEIAKTFEESKNNTIVNEQPQQKTQPEQTQETIQGQATETNLQPEQTTVAGEQGVSTNIVNNNQNIQNNGKKDTRTTVQEQGSGEKMLGNEQRSQENGQNTDLGLSSMGEQNQEQRQTTKQVEEVATNITEEEQIKINLERLNAYIEAKKQREQKQQVQVSPSEEVENVQQNEAFSGNEQVQTIEQPSETQNAPLVSESKSTNGKYTIRVEKNNGIGTAKILDNNGNEVKLTNKQKEKYVAEHFAKQTYPETVVEDADKLNPREFNQELVNTSNNPLELAQILDTESEFIPSDLLDAKENAIANVIGNKVSRSSFIQFDDANNITFSIAKGYGLTNKGKTIDVIAQEAEVFIYGDWDSQNPRVTTEDVINFMKKYNNGADTFFRQPNPTYRDAEAKFEKLTGVKATKNALDVLLGKKTATKIDFAKLQEEADILSAEEKYNLRNEYNEWFNSLSLEDKNLELQKTYPYEQRTEEDINQSQNKSVSNRQSESSENVANQERDGATTEEITQVSPSSQYEGAVTYTQFGEGQEGTIYYDNGVAKIKDKAGKIYSANSPLVKNLKDVDGNTIQLQKSNERLTPITKQAFDALVTKLQKAFPKFAKVTTDWNSFSIQANSLGISPQRLEVLSQDFRDGHTAPLMNYDSAQESLDNAGDFNLAEVARGTHNQPSDYFDEKLGPRYYGYNDTAGMQSFTAIKNIIRAIKAGKNPKDLTITLYRAVPNNINVNELIQYDWVSPSEKYAKDHGERRFGEGEYKIIKQEAPIIHTWWDGNDIREWGYDPSNEIRFMHNANGTVYGAKLPDGTIYLNPQFLNANTPIHEFSHLFEQLLPSRFKNGVELLKQTNLGKKLFEQLKQEGNYANLTDEQLWGEALNTHIGNFGENEVNNPKGKLKKLQDWIKDFFAKVGDVLGIKKLSPDTQLRMFTEGVVKDLLGGKPIVAENQVSPSEQVQYSLNSKTPLSVKEQTEVINDLVANGEDSAFAKLQETNWYKGLSEEQKQNVTPTNIAETIVNAVNSNKRNLEQKVERRDAKIEKLKDKSKSELEKQKKYYVDKINDIKQKYKDALTELNIKNKTAVEKVRERLDLRRSAVNQIKQLLSDKEVGKNVTPSEVMSLVRMSELFFNARDLDKAFDKFIIRFEKVFDKAQYRNKSAEEKFNDKLSKVNPLKADEKAEYDQIKVQRRNAVKIWKEKWFANKGGLIEPFLNARDKSIGLANWEIRVARNTVTNLDKEAKKIGFVKDSDWETFNKALGGDLSAIQSLPITIKPFVNTMRAQIDGLSMQLIENNLVTKEQAITIEDNLGKYITRGYEIFEGQDSVEKISKKFYRQLFKKDNSIVARFDVDKWANAVTVYQQNVLNEIEMENSDKYAELDTEEKKQSFARQEGERRLLEYIASLESDYKQQGSAIGADTSVLEQRKEVPTPIRRLLGEYTDPRTSFLLTISRVSNLAYQRKFLSQVKEIGMGTLFFEEGDINIPTTHFVKIASDSNNRYSPLNGLYTTPEFKEIFLDIPKNTQNDFIKLLIKATGLVKVGKTVLSPMTQAVNFNANFGFLIHNGLILDVKQFGKAFQAFADDMTDGKLNNEIVKELVEENILGQNIAFNELEKDFGVNMEKEVLRTLSQSKTVKTAKDVLSMPFRLYKASDDFFKAFAYYAEADRYADAYFGKKYKELVGEERDKIRKIASEVVKNTMPNYDRRYKAADVPRKSTYNLLGNFLSFQAESIRTKINSIQYALSDIKNKQTRKAGIKRLAGIISYETIYMGVTTYLTKSMGMGMVGLLGFFDDDDEDEKNKKFNLMLPEWGRATEKYAVQEKDGTITWYAYGNSNPYGIWYKTANAYFNGSTNTKGGLVSVFDELLSPFLGTEMSFKWANNTFVSEENDYGVSLLTAKSKVDYTIDKLSPTIVKVIKDNTDSSKTNDFDIYNLIGIKKYNFDPTQQLGYRYNDYAALLADLESQKYALEKKVENGKATVEEIKEKWEDLDNKQKEIADEFREIKNAFETFGADSEIINAKAQKKFNFKYNAMNDWWDYINRTDEEDNK